VVHQWLLEQGVMPNVKDNSGVTPLHLASIKGYVTLVQLLLDSDSTVKKAPPPRFPLSFFPHHHIA
jgi:ankyrin repeat protein